MAKRRSGIIDKYGHKIKEGDILLLRASYDGKTVDEMEIEVYFGEYETETPRGEILHHIGWHACGIPLLSVVDEDSIIWLGDVYQYQGVSSSSKKK